MTQPISFGARPSERHARLVEPCDLQPGDTIRLSGSERLVVAVYPSSVDDGSITLGLEPRTAQERVDGEDVLARVKSSLPLELVETRQERAARGVGQ